MKNQRFSPIIGSICLISILALLLPLGACTPATSEEPNKPVPVLRVEPSGGLPKEPVVYYGAGFVPGEVIVLELETPGFTWRIAPKGSMGYHVANEYGAFVYERVFPRRRYGEGIEPGVYTLVARGDKGSVAVAPYRIMVEEEE